MIAAYKREIMSKPYEQTYQDRLRIGQVVAEALDSKTTHGRGEALQGPEEKRRERLARTAWEGPWAITSSSSQPSW